ncbi:MAG TPA: hypothetical protein PK280_02885 [Planctomycetota bacterium]|nr:hypothetical protein [Planctomycetota bacterium]
MDEQSGSETRPPTSPASPVSPVSPPAADQQGAAAPAPGRGPGAQVVSEAMRSAQNSNEYRDKRRGWIREHASDDSFLIFLGVIVALAVLGVVAYRLIPELRKPPPVAPVQVPLAAIFNGARAEEGPPGTITVFYDFAMRSDAADLRSACPQINDWHVPGGTVSRVESDGGTANSGVLVSGKFSRHIPYFVPGDLSVECDAALLQGTELALHLDSIDEGRVGDGYRLEVCASRAEGEEASAAIVEYRRGSQVRSSPPARLPELLARRNPPLFYRLKFELRAGMLRACFQGKEVLQLPVGETKPGSVLLMGPNSRTAFDNVTIVGQPHPSFIKPRVEMYRLFGGPAGAAPGTQPAPGK